MGTQKEAKIVDGGDSAEEVMQEAVEEGHVPVYEARGCRYEFEAANSPFGHEGEATAGVIVYCYGRGGTVNWSGATGVGPATRIVDAKRSARKAWEVSRQEN